MREILQAEGLGVCRTAYGKQLGGGLFEFRLRHDAAEILRSLGRTARAESTSERILLRVFCHAYGDRIILLLAATTKEQIQVRSASRRRSPQPVSDSPTSSDDPPHEFGGGADMG